MHGVIVGEGEDHDAGVTVVGSAVGSQRSRSSMTRMKWHVEDGIVRRRRRIYESSIGPRSPCQVPRSTS